MSIHAAMNAVKTESQLPAQTENAITTQISSLRANLNGPAQAPASPTMS